MRFDEIKPIKPLTPSEQRVRSLRQQIEQSRRALAAERERQRREKERLRQQRAQGLAKP